MKEVKQKSVRKLLMGAKRTAVVPLCVYPHISNAKNPEFALRNATELLNVWMAKMRKFQNSTAYKKTREVNFFLPIFFQNH